MGIKLTLNNVRLAFPKLFTPEVFAGGNDPTPYFSSLFILPPDHPQLGAIRNAMRDVALETWPKTAAAMLKAAEASGKVPLRPGDTKPQYEDFPGNWFVSARSKTRPNLKDLDGVTPVSEADDKLYAGAYVNALIEIFGYTTGSNGIAASLRGVQFRRHGDAFGGGRPASDDEFTDLTVSNEDLA